MPTLANANPSCALYGGLPNYVNAFLPVNFLVILAGFSIIAVGYAASRFMPPSMSGKVTAVTRVEIVELVISAIIILMVLAFSLTACNISQALSNSITGSPSSPLFFSDVYIANLTFNTGLTLLTDIYSYSIAYQIDGAVWGYGSSAASSYLNQRLGDALQELESGTMILPITVLPTFGSDLGTLYNILGELFLVALAPLVITALGMLFVQWMLIPVIQATAFVIVLPVAIAMRSFAYAAAGPGLRQAANTVLALAIAAYIVYPLAVSFSPCIISWLYGSASCQAITGTNPLSQYVSPYGVTSLTPGEFSSLGSGSYQTSALSIQMPAIGSLLDSAGSIGLPGLNPFATLGQLQPLINDVAQFMFIAVFLFGLDLGITFAFAMGLTRALNSGIEGEARFWGE